MKRIIHHVHRLRKHPEEKRRHILHISIVIIAVIMILLWVYSLGKTISTPEAKVKAKQDLQPFSVLKDNLVDGYKSVSDDKNQ